MSKCLTCMFVLFMTFICMTISVRCVMGCYAAMATGVLKVLPVGVLCSVLSSRISSLKRSLYCEKCWKRVTGRGWTEGYVGHRQRDSIIWSAWAGKGCVPVSFQREMLLKCVWDRAESSDARTHFTVLHCKTYQTGKRGVESCPGEYMHVLRELYTRVIRWLWRFIVLFITHKHWFDCKFALFWVFLKTVLGLFI